MHSVVCFTGRGIAARFILGVLVSGVTALAQLQSGRIVGSVYDPQHAKVTGATLTVTNAATNVSKTLTTDTDGDYVVTPLDPGTYNVRAAAPGFQTTVQNGVELTVGQSVRVDLALVLGSTATEVQVTAAAPLLNTEAGGLGQVIDNTQIVNMPLNGRSFTELARLAPGAALLAPSGNVQNVRPELVNGNVVSGVRGSQTMFLLDGVDVSEEHQGGTWIQTSIDALQEFSVQQNAYSAEFAGAGGTFNSTTKPGTNEFHGALFEFLRNDKLDARNFFAQTREILKRNQFGATLGGPVWIPKVYNGRNKTFFFISYEGQTQRDSLVTNSIVPSIPQRNGDFSARGLNPIYDPLTTRGTTRTQFSGNIIPASRLSPQALFFNRYIPLPNSGTGTFVSAPVAAYDSSRWTIRGDRQISSSTRLFVRYSRNGNTEDDQDAFPALGSSHLEGPASDIAAAVTSTIGSKIVHEFRFSHLFGKYRSTAYFQGQGAQIDQQAGITGLQGLQQADISSIPAFTFSGYSGFFGNVNDGRPKWQDRSVYEFDDNLTWISGKHILKFGTRIYHRTILFTDSRNQNGAFNYTGVMTQNPASSTGTGDSMADWMLGFPASVGRSNPATWWGGTGTYWHFFAQDDIKVSERLTLNIGLRYEYTPWLTPYRNQGATFDPSSPKPIIVSSDTDTIDLAAQPAASVGYSLYGNLIQTTHQAGLPITVTSNDTKQFAPRIGFAWRPFGEKTVVRGGYGIFYEFEGTSGRLNFNFLPFSLSETINAQINVIPNRTTADFFLGSAFGAGISAAAWLPLPKEAQFGRDYHWNFGFQRQLGQGVVFEADYVGTRGLHLPTTRNINYPAPGPGAIQARRPYPLFGNITYNTQDSSAIYHSLQTKLQRQHSSGVWYLVAYTFSKSITIQEAPGKGGNGIYEKALSSFDVPHVFSFSGGYALPFGKGKRFLSSAGGLTDALLGGWQLQNLISFRSGIPYTPVISRDVANTGAGNQRPIRLGACQNTGLLSPYFNVTAFAVPANFIYGNSGANICRSDYQGQVDLSLFKIFNVTERSKLQFRAEAFNVNNSAYFNAPGAGGNAAIDTSAGPRVTSTSNRPRQIQFALKYTF
ncbi:MAG: carboxypeptidase regulatory-like domain-containing protein [Bryobacteraceae bacterium]